MGHGHDHAAGDAAVPRSARRWLTTIAAVLAAVTVVGVALLWPRHDVRANTTRLGLISNVYAAKVTRVTRQPCTGTLEAQQVRCSEVTFRLSQGPDRGKTRTIEIPDSPTSPHLAAGDAVVLNHIPHAQPGFEYTYADRQRRPVLLWLAVIFAVAVIALGRLRGLAALVGLGASIVVILVFMLPSMLDGNNAPLVAIVGASAVAFLALYIANGLRPMTTVALLGTLCALGLTVGLATLFTNLAHFTGAASEDATLVRLGTSAIDLKGLVLAGMVLGALGALNDITVTQASAVGELRAANPAIGRVALYRSGLRIGRDHISSTVNTLALAYAGASLPLLILFSLSGQSLGTVANGELVAVEIVATLVGSIGLVAAVPLSTWFATLVATEHVGEPRRRRRRAVRPGEPTDEPDEHTDHPAELADATTDATAAGPADPDAGVTVPVGARSRRVLDDAALTRRERRALATRRRRVRRPPPPADDLLAPRDDSDFWT